MSDTQIEEREVERAIEHLRYMSIRGDARPDDVNAIATILAALKARGEERNEGEAALVAIAKITGNGDVVSRDWFPRDVVEGVQEFFDICTTDLQAAQTRNEELEKRVKELQEENDTLVLGPLQFGLSKPTG